MRMRSLIQLAAVGVFLFGCASTAERMAEKGIEPMTAENLRTLVIDNSLHETSGQGEQGWEWAAYYKSDGTMTGRAWGTWGQNVGSGIWEITDDGLLCEDWDNQWGGGGYGCYRFYQDGENIIYDHARGSKGQQTTGTMTQAEGNPYNL